jgi:hypothetical protein
LDWDNQPEQGVKKANEKSNGTVGWPFSPFCEKF